MKNYQTGTSRSTGFQTLLEVRSKEQSLSAARILLFTGMMFSAIISHPKRVEMEV
ncbi:MAG: hypothetical protein JRJ29_09880 [Deltaproteobacteria bacterium]|nr:hypothetical protein [Deltaproteobacteria bacterium]